MSNDGHIIWKSDGSIELTNAPENAFDHHRPYAPEYYAEDYAQGAGAPSPQKNSLNQRISEIANYAREIEEQLQTERNYSKQLREYSHRLRYEMAQLQKSESELRREIAQRTQKDGQAIERAKTLSEELNRLKTEYEKMLHINHAEKVKCDAAVQQAQKYQQDLQDAVVRLHKTEARFSELAIELQKIEEEQQACRTELESIVETQRKEFEEQISSERLKIQDYFEKEIASKVRMARDESSYLIRQKEDENFRTSQSVTKLTIDLESAKAEIAQLQATIGAEKKRTQSCQNEILTTHQTSSKKDEQIARLVMELRNTQEIISMEKSQLRSLVDRIRAESESESRSMVDPKALVKVLEGLSDTPTVTSGPIERAKPSIPLPRARFDINKP
jgi:DNA repair exonuclease SbcCD ATPase subunit